MLFAVVSCALLLSHGRPGSVLEFCHAIGPLTDPEAHGGSAADAFDVVIPSLPGLGFSGHPTGPGWNLARTAQAWAVLRERLGYPRWFAQGGDLGASVTAELAALELGSSTRCSTTSCSTGCPTPPPPQRACTGR